jgi:anti-anti-sigma factor
MNDLVRIETSHHGARTVIRVIGEVDVSNARDLHDAALAAIPATAGCAVVDLADTTYLDSTGIEMLFRLAEVLHTRRQELRLLVPPDATVRTVVELTRIGQVIPVDDGPDEATSS